MLFIIKHGLYLAIYDGVPFERQGVRRPIWAEDPRSGVNFSYAELQHVQALADEVDGELLWTPIDGLRTVPA